MSIDLPSALGGLSIASLLLPSWGAGSSRQSRISLRFAPSWRPFRRHQMRRGMAVGSDGRLHFCGYNGVTRFYKPSYVLLGGSR